MLPIDALAHPMASPIHLTIAAQVAEITLHDPPRRNALGRQVRHDLLAAFAQCAAHPVRAVILRAARGDRVWCSGFDINELTPGFDPLAPGGELLTLFGVMAALPAPVIGMISGSCWGGGCDLALSCDMLIGDETAAFALTPAKIGLPYDQRGVHNAASRAGRNAAMEMFATGEPVDADRALRLGLLNHLVPAAELESFTRAMAARIAANAPLAVAAAKAILHGAGNEARSEGLASQDLREGITAFLTKRTPAFKGT
jgi:methylmalonyl-CoA decarboxylase